MASQASNIGATNGAVLRAIYENYELFCIAKSNHAIEEKYDEFVAEDLLYGPFWTE